MGIEDLKSFISENLHISRPYKLHDRTVIFDGWSLMRHLYCFNGLDCIHGGEYKKYSDNIRSFISSLQKCRIKPIVVGDEGYEKIVRNFKNANKSAENIFRKADNINKDGKFHGTVFPLLISEVFYSVLLELSIKFLITDYNTDNQVVVQGNHHKCPVISNNGIIYLMDAHCGFIILNSIDKTVYTEKMSNGVECNFLNCRMYCIDEFLKLFPGLDKNIGMPLFGALIGNRYFGQKSHENFFAELPEYTSEKLYLEKGHFKIMANLLCWLQHKTLEEVLNSVTSHLEETKQRTIESEITSFVESFRCSIDNNIDFKNDLHLNRIITTPCGEQLSENFIKQYCNDFSRFFVSVIGMHKVFLIPQVENFKLLSSYECTSYIRQVMYGILVKHDINGTECKNQQCTKYITEYDRGKVYMEDRFVQPIYSVEGKELPKVTELHSIDKDTCSAVIAKVLGIRSDFFLDVPDVWKLFIASINYWLRKSGCRSQSLIFAVTLNLIYFGLIKAKNPFPKPEVCTEKTSKSCPFRNISCIVANVNKNEIYNAEMKLEEHYNATPPNVKTGILLKVMHSFSQLQACLLHTIYLNRLLNNHLINPNPENCFSGVMLFNLTQAIYFADAREYFINQILGIKLHSLFSLLNSKICENVDMRDFS